MDCIVAESLILRPSANKLVLEIPLHIIENTDLSHRDIFAILQISRLKIDSVICNRKVLFAFGENDMGGILCCYLFSALITELNHIKPSKKRLSRTKQNGRDGDV